MDIKEILKDIENRLNIDVDKSNVNYFTDGATESLVFSIDNKYLIKTMDKNTLDIQKEFLKVYTYDYFQKIIFCNEELKYICFEYVLGDKFYDYKSFDKKDIINQIYNIANGYKEYKYDGFGYLYEDHKSWYEFLYDEVMYSKKDIDWIPIDKVINALDVIKKYSISKYLIHGDFGTHNFLIENGRIKVIDPMGVVGDYLYDFYFAILSNVTIFKEVDINYILDFYDRDMKYKKSLFIVVLYIRMSRCYKYNQNNFNYYLEVFEKI